MKIINDLISTLPEGKIVDVRVGLHWTAVVAEVAGKEQCGLSSTISLPHDHTHGVNVPSAGKLLDLESSELAAYANSDRPTMTSIGIATINALLPQGNIPYVELNAESVIAEYGKDKNVAIIGSFPFVPNLKNIVKKIFVIEKNPELSEYSPEDAKTILPTCDVIAITGMTLVNHTFDEIIKYCPDRSTKLMLGPSTPLSPVLFDYGIQLLSGSIVRKIGSVLKSVGQGANFKQVHRAGVDLVTIKSPQF